MYLKLLFVGIVWFWNFDCYLFRSGEKIRIFRDKSLQISGGFRGGDGGDASPPTSLKVTILAEKSASIWNNSAPVRDASPPTNLNLTNPAEKSKNHSQFWWRPFFFLFWRPPNFGRKKRLNFRFRPKNHTQFWWRPLFFFIFFFWRPPDFGRKKVWISAFGRKITLNFGEDIRIFEILCLKSPHTKIF